MGFYEATGDEERLVLVAAQIFDGAVGSVVIAMVLTVAFKHDDAVGIGDALAALGFDGGGGGLGVVGEQIALADYFANGGGLHAAFISGFAAAGFLPGFGIVNAAMKDFTGTDGGIAIFPEQLGQAGPVRMGFAEGGAIAEHAGGGRFATGEQG